MRLGLGLLAGGVLWVGLAVLAACTLATAFAERLWIGDLLVMFVPHLFGAALLLTGLAALTRRRLVLLPALALAVLHGWTLLAPVQAPAAAGSADGPGLRVVTFNVEFDNPETGPLRRFLERTRPDILVLEEATPQWRSALRAWGDLYPYTTLTDQGRDITLVIASRHPILATRRMLGNSRPSRSFDRTYIVRAAIDVDGRPLVVYAVHPPSPRRALLWPRRNLYLATLAEQFQRFPGDTPVVMAGDFNTAPWSPFFARLLERTGLLPAARSRWPAPTRVFKDLHLPAWLGVPIDHILVSPGMMVQAYGPGPDLGSDHLPVVADLVLPGG